MLRKITLKNFMSHAETVVELADGLTVLTGPNNCGKSAIVAALQTLASNGRTTHVRRHGEKTASVAVETDNGDCVQWERSGKTVKYIINGEDVHRVGQSVPDGLHEILKLDRVDLGTGKAADRYDIHFGEQKSPVFLLSDTGSRAAQFFASSSDVSRLIEMQALHRSRIRDRKKEQKRLEKESAENLARLAVLKPIESINTLISNAESIADTVAKGAGQCDRLKNLVDSIERKQAEYQKLKDISTRLAQLDKAATSPDGLLHEHKRCVRIAAVNDGIDSKIRLKQKLSRHDKALENLRALPTQHPLGEVCNLADNLSATRRKIDRLEHVCKVLAAMTEPPQQQPEEACQRLLSRLETTQQSAANLRSSSDISETLCKPPEFQDVAQLQNLLDRMIARQETLNTIRTASKSLDRLGAIEPPKETARLIDLINRTQTLKKKRGDAFDAAARADDQLNDCANSIEAFVEANPKCSVCGGDLDSATLMSAASDSCADRNQSHDSPEDRPQT